MKKVFAFLVLVFAHTASSSQAVRTLQDNVYTNFKSPPNAAKPRVWWHWMNGNITKDGIAKDLLWMHQSGIGGFQNFDAALATPQIVEKRLIYMTPEWKDAFRFTTRMADSLHLEMAIAGSPGWSESGGPWVKPQDGMKKIVWTETLVKTGASNIKITKPLIVTGPFQNIPKQPEFGSSNAEKEPPTFYNDICVIAYKLPDNDIALSELNPTVTSSSGNFDLTQLTDGDLAKTNLLPRDSVKGYAWIQFTFAKLQTIKSVTLVGGGDKGPFGLYGELKDTRSLEASDDGEIFHQVCFIPAGAVLQQTINIPVTTAKFFRVTFKNPPSNNLGALFGMGGNAKPPAGTDIAELVLHTASRVNMFEEKDAFAPAPALYTKATTPTNDLINPVDVVDVTDKLSTDGILNWNVPEGNWHVLRFGYTLTGITNHPASPEATGLEVDKLDSAAVKSYFTNYLDQYKNATGGLMGSKGGLQFMVTDSWEAGAQNWTAKMLEEFQKRRGYSMLPWMPVLTGHIVKSAAASDQFLFDYRKTLSDLVASYHYDALTNILARYGMKRYSESQEDRRAMIADGMEIKRTAAIPMSAMWTPSIMNGGDQTDYEADIRESASVAHIYGQNLVAAESLTALGLGGNAWSYAPENLKPTADLELANGLNRFVIHTSVHQPVDDKIPGLGLGPFGQWFNRHDTWAGVAKTWTDYLSRSSYLLQQGKFAADLLIYYGEDNNITSLYNKKLPVVPEGYNYDFINSDALINLLSVKDGMIVTPSGMSYRLLVLDTNAKQMSLTVLKKLQRLVEGGATITGIKPENTPSLSDDEKTFESAVNKIWNTSNAKVFTGKSLDDVMTSLHITPDFTYTKSKSNTKLLYVHRKLSDRDIYWINSRNDAAQDIEATFRIKGKTPELWHPETGLTENMSYRIINGVTTVNLHLQPNDAVFVVFAANAVKTSVTIPPKTEKQLTTLEGSWKVSFQKDRGAPTDATFDVLSSYTENADAGIKYFSGTANYTKTVSAKTDWFKNGSQLWLDLGEVKNIAEVVVNGKSLGILWKKPFRIDITRALKPGENQLSIKIINLWVNRLIGDAQPGVTNKITFTTMPFYQAKSPLLPSGLLGPVQILER